MLLHNRISFCDSLFDNVAENVKLGMKILQKEVQQRSLRGIRPCIYIRTWVDISIFLKEDKDIMKKEIDRNPFGSEPGVQHREVYSCSVRLLDCFSEFMCLPDFSNCRVEQKSIYPFRNIREKSGLTFTLPFRSQLYVHFSGKRLHRPLLFSSPQVGNSNGQITGTCGDTPYRLRKSRTKNRNNDKKMTAFPRYRYYVLKHCDPI